MEVEKVLDGLRKIYPQFVYSEAGGGNYYKSLYYRGAGECVEDPYGRTWMVVSGWEWLNYRGISIYMAELELV